jgi:hypothetical protein
VVRTAREALSCFLRTDMDAIALGPFLVDRASPRFPDKWRTRVRLAAGELPSDAGISPTG